MPEYGATTTPGKRSEPRRALKRGNENRILLDPVSSPPEAATTAPSISPSPPAEKRRYPRYKCEGSVEFRTEGVDMRTWATITDLSLCGGYVELAATSAVNTVVHMILDMREVRVRLKGIVRTSHPLLGMGIEFTEIADDEKPHLEELLLRLASDTSAQGKIKSVQTPAVPDLVMIMDAGAALNAVAKFFQSNHALTRAQFTELIGKSQDRDREELR
jgi:hypothetical protein